MAVFMELAPGDTLIVGRSRIRLERKSGGRARLAIDSHEDVERIKAGDAVPPAAPKAAAPVAAPAQPMPVLRRPVPNPPAN